MFVSTTRGERASTGRLAVARWRLSRAPPGAESCSGVGNIPTAPTPGESRAGAGCHLAGSRARPPGAAGPQRLQATCVRALGPPGAELEERRPAESRAPGAHRSAGPVCGGPSAEGKSLPREQDLAGAPRRGGEREPGPRLPRGRSGGTPAPAGQPRPRTAPRRARPGAGMTFGSERPAAGERAVALSRRQRGEGGDRRSWLKLQVRSQANSPQPPSGDVYLGGDGGRVEAVVYRTLRSVGCLRARCAAWRGLMGYFFYFYSLPGK